jgi:transposase
MSAEASAKPRRIDGRGLSHGTSQAIRHLAVAAVRRGEAPSRVMERFGFCRTTIYRWMNAVAKGGERALDRRPHPGRAPRVGAADAEALRGAIVGRAPRDLGLSGPMWTRTAVAELVRRRLKIWIGPMGAGRLLRRIGLNPVAVRSETEPGRPLLFAVDGRRSFLCESRDLDASPEKTLRQMETLAARAGRPVRFVFAGGDGEDLES